MLVVKLMLSVIEITLGPGIEFTLETLFNQKSELYYLKGEKDLANWRIIKPTNVPENGTILSVCLICKVKFLKARKNNKDWCGECKFIVPCNTCKELFPARLSKGILFSEAVRCIENNEDFVAYCSVQCYHNFKVDSNIHGKQKVFGGGR